MAGETTRLAGKATRSAGEVTRLADEAEQEEVLPTRPVRTAAEGSRRETSVVVALAEGLTAREELRAFLGGPGLGVRALLRTVEGWRVRAMVEEEWGCFAMRWL